MNTIYTQQNPNCVAMINVLMHVRPCLPSDSSAYEDHQAWLIINNIHLPHRRMTATQRRSVPRALPYSQAAEACLDCMSA